MRVILITTLLAAFAVAEINSDGVKIWPKFSNLEWGITAKETVARLKAQGFKQDGEIRWGRAGAFFDLTGQAFDCDVSVGALAPDGEGLGLVVITPKIENKDILSTAIKIRDSLVERYGKPKLEKYAFYDKNPWEETEAQPVSLLSRGEIDLALNKKHFKLEILWGPLNPEVGEYLSIKNSESLGLRITFQGPDSIRGGDLLSEKQDKEKYGISKEGLTLQQEEKKTIKQLKAGVNRGDAKAQIELGKRFAQGDGVEQDVTKAVALYRKAAEQGQAEAQMALAIFYLSGSMGVAENLDTAVEWYKKSAEGGFSEAQAALAEMYEIGLGVNQDLKIATKWYLRAAEQGHIESQLKIGVIYKEGQRVQQSDRSARKWLRSAAAAGNMKAHIYLGAINYDGDDLGGNYLKAYNWFLPAAEQGDDTAQHWIGRILSHGGDGIAQDLKESAKWYRKSAEKGNKTAQFILSELYVEGRGVPQDYPAAYMWINLLASEGDADAIEMRKEFLKFLSKEQVAEGQRLTREWLKKKIEAEKSAGIEKTIQEKEGRIDGRAIGTSSGTGFAITKDGHIVTNSHVIGAADSIRVFVDGEWTVAVVLANDKKNDLAIIKINKPTLPLYLKEIEGPGLGDPMTVAGFPNPLIQGRSIKVTKGTLSGLKGMADDIRHFQIDAAVQPGNSGGPLLDSTGAVVGIVNARLNDAAVMKLTGSVPQNVNYAIKVDYLIPLIKTVKGLHQKLKGADAKDNLDLDELEQGSVLLIEATTSSKK